jgi:predicted Zn-dependent peptidase
MFATLRAVLIAAIALAGPLPTLAGEPLPPNPFAGFRTVTLPNGLRVWYAHLPGATMTAMAVVVPAGRDADPRGREQTAHLLEHVLLSDRAGGTEAELARELARRGGSHGGFTTPSATVFPLTIPAVSADWGVRWLYDVVTPRLFGDHDALRNRGPVALEIGARPPVPALRALRRLVDAPLLRPAPFWRREFGLDVPEERPSAASALFAISGRDLQDFYDTWYSPPAMTLVVVSALPPAALVPVISETFGTLPWRPPGGAPRAAALRSGESRRFGWTLRAASASVTVRYRFAALTDVEHLRVLFLEDLLRHRLMERLRRGDDKAVYAVDVSTVLRGGVGFLAITADVPPGREAEVQQVIGREIERIKLAHADSAFVQDRDLLARRLRIDYGAPGALLAMAADRFATGNHSSMPDLGAYYASVGPDSIAATAAALFAPENTILAVTRPLPLPAGTLASLALLTAVLATLAYRRRVLRPADMQRIRFVAHLRPHTATRLLGAVLGSLAMFVVGGLGIAAARFAHGAWLASVDSFVLHLVAAGTGIFLCTYVGFAVTGRVPRKVLVFDEEIRIKSPTYAAVVIPRSRICDVSFGHAPVGRRRHPAGLPPVGRGVCVGLDDGSVLFLQVARPDALRHVLGADGARLDADLHAQPLQPGLAGNVLDPRARGEGRESMLAQRTL